HQVDSLVLRPASAKLNKHSISFCSHKLEATQLLNIFERLAEMAALLEELASMLHAASRRTWATLVIVGIGTLLFALVRRGRLWRQREKQRSLPAHPNLLRDPPSYKSFSLRITAIPASTTQEELERDLASIIDEDSDLKQSVREIHYHYLVQRDSNLSCATATVSTSLPAKELIKKLSQACRIKSYHFDVDFYGITPLYEDKDADVDVIAVPGLGSHAMGTWKSPKSDKIWLRDFLPHDIAGIRILVYGYDTSLLNSDSRASIEDLGSGLLASLLALRANTAYRPILFIGYSLGGLVVKETLVHASNKPNDQQCQNLRKSCYGLLFFGVPNFGLRNPQLVSIVQNKPNRVLVQDLVVDDDSEPSTFLKRLSDQFAGCCGNRFKYKIVSFYETKLSPTVEIQLDGTLTKTGSKIFMVTQKSATSTGLTSIADEDNIALPADHTGLVKYESMAQEEYSIVKERIKLLAAKARVEVGIRFGPKSIPNPPKPDRRIIERCLQSLAFKEMHSRSHEIVEPSKGTCQWLLKHGAYQKWVTERGLLWIRGKPGSGKSTLLKFAMKKAALETGNVHYPTNALVLSFFFHGRGSVLQRTPLGLFRSLLYQLLDHVHDGLPELVSKFDHTCKTIGKPGKSWDWLEEELQEYFLTSLPRVLKKTGVIIFIDAVDECGQAPAVKLVEFFEHSIGALTTETNRLGICLACRHYPELTLQYGSTLSTEEQNRDDIDSYVQTQLSRLNAEWAPTIASLVTERAAGVFMWARLVMDEVQKLVLEGASLENIKTAVRRVPEVLEDIYQNLTQVMRGQSDSLKLVRWICFAQRPLSADEMRWAIAVDPDIPHQSLKQYKTMVCDKKAMERRVMHLSCGLAEVVLLENATVVQFIHETVQQYFQDTGLLLLERLSERDGVMTRLFSARAHYSLSRICIRYLSMSEISNTAYSNPDDLLAAYSLVEYAANSWMVHVRNGERQELSQESLLEDLTRCDSFVGLLGYIWHHHLHHEESGESLTHLLAFHGLGTLLK
ncbi:hypothetical protein GQ53DRAFT_858785, partial [Thozetella sp. PMI_491]